MIDRYFPVNSGELHQTGSNIVFTGSFGSPVFDTGRARYFSYQVEVTTVAGPTPQLTSSLQVSNNDPFTQGGANTWVTVPGSERLFSSGNQFVTGTITARHSRFLLGSGLAIASGSAKVSIFFQG